MDTTKLGDAVAYRLRRDDDKDVAFRGWLLGEGTYGDRAYRVDWTRWTRVAVYLSEKGRYVAAIERHSKWQGQGSKYDAVVADSFASLVDALAADNEGRLGQASKAAIEDAVAGYPELSGADVESV